MGSPTGFAWADASTEFAAYASSRYQSSCQGKIRRCVSLELTNQNPCVFLLFLFEIICQFVVCRLGYPALGEPRNLKIHELTLLLSELRTACAQVLGMDYM